MRLPFDAGRRRRVYLMRHAEAAYYDVSGVRAPDPRLVPLTPTGRLQAQGMAELLSGAAFDRAICSGLPRTVETATIVLAGRALELEVISSLEEVHGGTVEERAVLPPGGYAYAMFQGAAEGARFAGGEVFADFRKRVLNGFAGVMANPDWETILMVCHGGVNRAIITAFLGLGLESFGSFEQDSACVNILDFDQLDSSEIVRRILRGVNITSYDTAKVSLRGLTMEGMAQRAAAAEAASTISG